MGSHRELGEAVVIKPIGWRQAGFTLFLFVCACFFAVIDYLGPLASWAGTLLLALTSLLSLLDQVFQWSRLKIDRDGYDLRGWFRRQRFGHKEIERFSSQEYAGRQLVVVHLSGEALQSRGLPDEGVPFPCAFGRPFDQVMEALNQNLDRTPRAKRKD